jgi:hypothetical protein
MRIFRRGKSAKSSHEKPLIDIKERIARLPTQFPTSAHTFGAGAMQAQEQIPIISRNIDQAVAALKTGIDPNGNPITKQQISSGLKNLVRATQKPAFIGLMSAVLDSNGIQQLERSMVELERIADGIGRG